MDYVSDRQMIYFSPGQAVRMWNILDNTNVTQRNMLWQPNNLAATGTGPHKAPTAQFACQHRVTCEGGPIQFIDYSRDMPTSWEWSFPGGNPATSTDQHPLVTYSTAGTYDVQLIVNNQSNDPDTILMPGYITVLSGAQPLPLVEGFDNSAVFPTGWQVWNPDSAITQIGMKWSLSALASGFGQSTRAARMNCGNYWSYFQEDHLITPSLDFSQGAASDTAAMMTFSVGYAPLFTLNRMFGDTLTVSVSTDCGLTWTPHYRKGGSRLSHNGTFFTTSEWGAPSASQWQRDTVDLTAYVGQPNVMVRFSVKNGAGNNLFIDDINIRYETPVGQADAPVFAEPATVAPNPTSGLTTLGFTLTQAQDVHIEVLDVNGRCLLHTHSGIRSSGYQTVDLNLEHLPAGIYLARLVANNQTNSVRIVRQ
jgi:PKD repeat protein